MQLRKVMAVGMLTLMAPVRIPHAVAEDYPCPWDRQGTTWDGGTILLNPCTSQTIVVYPPTGPVYSIDATQLIVAAAKKKVPIVAIKTKADLAKIRASAPVKTMMAAHLDHGAKLIVATATPVSSGSFAGMPAGYTGTPSVTLGGHNEGMYLDVHQEPVAPNNFANKVTELGVALAGVGREIANNSATQAGKAIGLALGALGLTIAAIGLTMKAIIASGGRSGSTDPDDPDPTPVAEPAQPDPNATAQPSAVCCATDNSNGPGMDGQGTPGTPGTSGTSGTGVGDGTGGAGAGGVSGGGGEGGSDG